jgi:hypothetical protein
LDDIGFHSKTPARSFSLAGFFYSPGGFDRLDVGDIFSCRGNVKPSLLQLIYCNYRLDATFRQAVFREQT